MPLRLQTRKAGQIMTKTMNKGRMTIRATALLLASAVMACSPGTAEAGAKGDVKAAAQPTAVHPMSGLPVIALTIETEKGRKPFRVELARTDKEQAKGLMFRTGMGADEGMLFIRNPPGVASFWMRNTVIPLDIIYIGTDGRILNIANAIPYDETPLYSLGIAAAVLELNGGQAEQLGIKPGDTVSWNLPAPAK